MVYKRQYGEKLSADGTGASTWIEDSLPSILESFHKDDIFNADETGLYFRAYPDRGHCLKNDTLSGGKAAKDRITVLLCANMTGTEKLPILVIGKSKQPRSFPKDRSKLPIEYDHSYNAWMTSDIFRRWLLRWDKRLSASKRKICLLIDNCSAHPADVDLSNITVRFLPPNTTCLIQPMDQGVIKNWKGHYRSTLNSRIIAELDVDPNRLAMDVAKKISVLDALHISKSSWDEVLPKTITNCFRKAWSRTQLTESSGTESCLEDVDLPHNMTANEFDAFVRMDVGVETSGELTNEELLEAVTENNSATTAQESIEVDDDNDDEPPLSTKQLLDFVGLFRKYVQQQGIAPAEAISFRSVEASVHNEIASRAKQQTLDDFLNNDK